MDGLRIDWNGTDLMTVEALSALDRRIGLYAIKDAVRRASRYVAREIKANITSNRSGVLRKSIGAKVKQTRSGTCYAKIGPRRGFEVELVRLGKGPRKLRKREQPMAKYLGLKTYKVSPTRYAHLVELGHGGWAPAKPHPFIDPAVQRTKATVEQILTHDLTAAIEKHRA